MNYSAIEDLVSTQYGDLTGLIQIDGHDNIMSIYQMCKDNNVDTTGKFIIGVGIEEFTISGIGKSGKVACQVLYLEKSKYGESFDEIETNIRDKKTLEVQKEVFYIDYSSIAKYVKRLSLLLVSKLVDRIDEIKIVDI